MARLSVRLLGPFQVALDGETVTGFESDKVRALLATIAAAPDRPHRREALAGLLWPEVPERSARASLRNALANLRRVIGDRDASAPFLHVTRQTIQVNEESDYWLDVAAFNVLLEGDEPTTEALEDAVALHRGPFMEGFSLPDSAAFEEWLRLQREQLSRQLVDALGDLIAAYEQQGAYEQALPYAWRQIELEPYQEWGQRQLMRLLALGGQRNAALAQYERYRELLAAELGVEPSQKIQAQHERFVEGELPLGPPAARRAAERPPRIVGPCPYRGLAPFREPDAPFFFGREAFTERLFQVLHRQPAAAVVVGPSGSGKSSVVFAGLLPRLRDAENWLIVDLRPGRHPFHTLARALTSLLEPTLGETDRLMATHKLAGALQEGSVDLRIVLERAAERASGSTDAGSRGVLLLIDQFEELYTLCPDRDTRRHFLDTLLAGAEAGSTRRRFPLVALLTLRADFVGQALGHRPLADALQEGSLMLGPMTRDELQAAIEAPAEKQGAAFEAGLVERLLGDVGEEPGHLPLLEFALTLLWERMDRGWMTHAAYDAIGRVEGALARYAQEVFDELAEDEQEVARQIFVQLVQPGEGTEDTRRVATRSELGEDRWALVHHLADRRLVVTGQDAVTGAQTVEVVHEALIQRWGQLREWMGTNRAFRTWQEWLRIALREWEASGEDEGALLRGAPLVEAEEWLEEREDELSGAEAAFIRAGVALRERSQRERERRRRRVILGLSGALVVALILTLLAGQQWQRAEREVNARATAEAAALAQREEALRQASVGLAAKALAELEGIQPDRGVLLALETLERYPYTPQAESALAQAVEVHIPYQVLRWGPYTWSVGWSPDGGKIAATAETGVIIWDATTGAPWSRIWLDETRYCNGRDVAWSPDGQRLVAVGDRMAEGVDEACVAPRIWDALEEEPLLAFTGHEGAANSVDWSPDGSHILSAGADGVARIWDAETGEERLTLPVHAGGLIDAVWSPDGTRIATAAADASVTVWSVPIAPEGDGAEEPHGSARTGRELITLPCRAEAVNGIAWSPSGDRIATAGADGLGRVWLVPEEAGEAGDLAGGQLLFSLSGHSDEVRGVAWSPDGEWLATTSADGTARLWDAATGEALLALRSLSGELQNVAWSPSGDRLVAGGGAVLPVWDVSRRPMRLSGHTDDVWDAQWSPDGSRIGTSSYDGTARIWDAATGEELLVLEHPAGVRFFDWSPDGTHMVTASRDGFARVWDAGSGALLVEVAAPEGDFFFVPSWSPDGSRFAAATAVEPVVAIFDAATGAPVTRFKPFWAHRVPWSPDGTRIVTGGYEWGIWDVSTGEALMTRDDYHVYNAAWSPDGERLVLGHPDGEARVFDTTSGEELLLFTGHSDIVWHASWSPNGERIASGDQSGEVRVWDAETGAEVLSFRAPDAVYSVNWSPDGQWVIAGGLFNPPVIRHAWQSTEALIADARDCCVDRELTDVEREQLGLLQP